MKPQWLIAGFFMLGMAVMSAAGAEQSKDMVNFSDPVETGNYAAGQGVSFRVERSGEKPYLEITVEPFEKHGNQWPIFTMAINAFHKPIDLTHYSHIEVEYEKVTEGLVNLTTLVCTLPYNDRGTNMEYFTFVIPGGTRMTQVIDLMEIRKPINDPSNLQCLQVALPCTSQTEIYRLYSFKAVRKPGASTIGDVAWQKTVDLEKEISILKQLGTVDTASLEKKLVSLQSAAKERAAKGFAGTYRSLSARIDELSGEVNKLFLASLKDPLYLWQYPTTAVLAEGVTPRPISPRMERLTFDMAQGMYQGETFMVSAVNTPLELTATLELPADLKDRAELFYTDYYRIYSQDYVIGDLVSPWTEGKVLSLPAGESRELRLRINSNGLKAGTYPIAVRLSDAARGVEQTLSGEVTVWPFQLVNYDQMDNFCYAVFPAGNEAEVERHHDSIAIMKRYGVNVVELGPELFNKVTLDEQGNVVDLDTTILQYSVGRVAEYWNELPGDQRIKFQLFVHRNVNIPEDHPNRQQAYLQWIEKVIETMRSFGLADDQVCFAMSDEASVARLVDIDIPLALAMKERWPDVLTFTNSSQAFNDPTVSEQYLKAFDIFAPEGHSLRRNDYLREFVLNSGKIKSVYKCDFMGRPNAEYYSYYRVFAWDSFQMGISSLGLWTFNAQEHNATFYSKDQSPGNVGYSLTNRNPENVQVTTRRFEIYHDGLNDLRFLLTLKSLDDSAETAQFIDNAVAAVVADPLNTELADAQRRLVAERILEISKRTAN